MNKFKGVASQGETTPKLFIQTFLMPPDLTVATVSELNFRIANRDNAAINKSAQTRNIIRINALPLPKLISTSFVPDTNEVRSIYFRKEISGEKLTTAYGKRTVAAEILMLATTLLASSDIAQHINATVRTPAKRNIPRKTR